MAPPAKQLAKRGEPRCWARARTAVAATSGASQDNGTNCCWFSARWDSGGAGGIAPTMSGAVKSERHITPRRRREGWSKVLAVAMSRGNAKVLFVGRASLEQRTGLGGSEDRLSRFGLMHQDHVLRHRVDTFLSSDDRGRGKRTWVARRAPERREAHFF